MPTFPKEVKNFSIDWKLGEPEPKLQYLVENSTDVPDLHDYVKLEFDNGGTIFDGYVMRIKSFYTYSNKVKRFLVDVLPSTLIFSRTDVEKYYKSDSNKQWTLGEILDDLANEYKFKYVGACHISDVIDEGDRFDAVGSLMTVLQALAERMGCSGLTFYSINNVPYVMFIRDLGEISAGTISVPADKIRLATQRRDGNNVWNSVVVSAVVRRNMKKKLGSVDCSQLKEGIEVDLLDDDTEKKFYLDSVNNVTMYVHKKKKIRVYVDDWSGTTIEGSIHVEDTESHSHYFSGSDTVTISGCDDCSIGDDSCTVCISDSDTVNIAGNTSVVSVKYSDDVTVPSDDAELHITGVAKGYVWVDFSFVETVELDYKVVDWAKGKIKVLAPNYDCNENDNPDVLEVELEIKDIVIDFSIAKATKVEKNKESKIPFKLTFRKFVEGVVGADAEEGYEENIDKLESLADNVLSGVGGNLEEWEFQVPTLYLMNSGQSWLVPGMILNVEGSVPYAGNYFVTSIQVNPSITTFGAVPLETTENSISQSERYTDDYVFKLYRSNKGGLIPHTQV